MPQRNDIRSYTQNEVVWAAIPIPKAFGIRDPNSPSKLGDSDELFSNHFELGISCEKES